MAAQAAGETLDAIVTGRAPIAPAAGRSGRSGLGVRGGRRVAAAAPAGHRADGSMGTA